MSASVDNKPVEDSKPSNLNAKYEVRRLQASGESVAAGLTHLAMRDGLTWVDIAALMGVSVPALRKWRHGATPRRRVRERLTSLIAFLDTIREYGVVEPAGLLSCRLLDEYVVTMADVFAPQAVPTLLNYCAGATSADQVLDAVGPKDWRVESKASILLAIADDGEQEMRLATHSSVS